MRFSWAAAGVVFLCGLFALGQPAPYEGAVTMGEITLPEVPKDSEPPEAVSPAAKYGALTVYKVEAGDSLYWIATTYGLSVEELKDLNNLESDVIRVGQRLLVPFDQVKYYPVGVRLTSQEVEWLAQINPRGGEGRALPGTGRGGSGDYQQNSQSAVSRYPPRGAVSNQRLSAHPKRKFLHGPQ